MGKKLTKEEFIRRVYENNQHVRNGEVEILGEYDGLEKHIEYLCRKCGNVQNPVALSLMVGNGCKVCGKIQSWKTQSTSNEEFQNRLQQLRQNGQDVFSDDEYINNHTKIWFYCSKGHRWDSQPASILDGCGCPYCSNKRVLVGYNDIATTSPDIWQFLANKEDGYKYVRWSNKRVDFKCTLCGHVQNRKICTVAHRGFKCECCGDGLSYPNKFGRALFDQLLINKYQAEYSPEWAKPYVYDIYFQYNGREYLVEWDGRQHFKESGSFGVPWSKYRDVDKTKDELAKDNNVILIRINCEKSEYNYIIHSIQQSELNNLFDLSNIDWMLCEERAQNNLVKLVCDLWMSGMQSFEELSKYLHLGNSTVRDYIRKGVRLGWCDYDSKGWIKERTKSIYIFDIANNKEYFFDSLQECANATIDICGHRVAEETIRKYCTKGTSYCGLIFKSEKIHSTKLINNTYE